MALPFNCPLAGVIVNQDAVDELVYPADPFTAETLRELAAGPRPSQPG